MFVEGTLPPLRSVENVSSAAKATVMVMVTDGLKAVPFNRFFLSLGGPKAHKR